MVPECRPQTPANPERHPAAAKAPGKRSRSPLKYRSKPTGPQSARITGRNFRPRPSVPLSARNRPRLPRSAPLPRANFNWAQHLSQFVSHPLRTWKVIFFSDNHQVSRIWNRKVFNLQRQNIAVLHGTYKNIFNDDSQFARWQEMLSFKTNVFFLVLKKKLQSKRFLCLFCEKLYGNRKIAPYQKTAAKNPQLVSLG